MIGYASSWACRMVRVWVNSSRRASLLVARRSIDPIPAAQVVVRGRWLRLWSKWPLTDGTPLSGSTSTDEPHAQDDPAHGDRRPAPVQHRGTLCPLVRRCPGRDVLRRGRRSTAEPPPRPRRQPQGQLRVAHRPRHPGPLPPRSPGIHDPPSGRAQVQTSRSASPQTTARQRHHPTYVERRRQPRPAPTPPPRARPLDKRASSR